MIYLWKEQSLILVIWISKMFLLDTNIVSELRKPTPNKGLLKWTEETPSSLMYLSVVTIGEIRKGIASKKQKDKKIRGCPR